MSTELDTLKFAIINSDGDELYWGELSFFAGHNPTLGEIREAAVEEYTEYMNNGYDEYDEAYDVRLIRGSDKP